MFQQRAHAGRGAHRSLTGSIYFDIIELILEVSLDSFGAPQDAELPRVDIIVWTHGTVYLHEVQQENCAAVAGRAGEDRNCRLAGHLPACSEAPDDAWAW